MLLKKKAKGWESKKIKNCELFGVATLNNFWCGKIFSKPLYICKYDVIIESL